MRLLIIKRFLQYFLILFFFLLSSLIFVSDSNAVVRITNMDDFTFGTWSGSGDMTLQDFVCIHDSAAAMMGSYRITATGSGTGGQFSISRSGTATISYSVSFQGSMGAMTTLTSGTSTTFRRAHRTSQTCAGGTNATIQVQFLNADLQVAPAGDYTGTLTILLQP